MLIYYILFSLGLINILLILFYLISKKTKWEALAFSTFECGFNSYFLSRFSFSIHYFLIALIFLIFDLEICMVKPYFNLGFNNLPLIMGIWVFLMILVFDLVLGWTKGHLNWKF